MPAITAIPICETLLGGLDSGRIAVVFCMRLIAHCLQFLELRHEIRMRELMSLLDEWVAATALTLSAPATGTHANFSHDLMMTPSFR